MLVTHRLTRPRCRRSFEVGPRRPNRSKQGTDRANAVRQLGVPAGTGGKANYLCSWGIWETPKPRYREETKPVREVAWDHFRANHGAEELSEETHPAPQGAGEFRQFLGSVFFPLLDLTYLVVRRIPVVVTEEREA